MYVLCHVMYPVTTETPALHTHGEMRVQSRTSTILGQTERWAPAGPEDTSRSKSVRDRGSLAVRSQRQAPAPALALSTEQGTCVRRHSTPSKCCDGAVNALSTAFK